MAKYSVTVTVTCKDTVTIEANSKEEAETLAKFLYYQDSILGGDISKYIDGNAIFTIEVDEKEHKKELKENHNNIKHKKTMSIPNMGLDDINNMNKEALRKLSKMQ